MMNLKQRWQAMIKQHKKISAVQVYIERRKSCQLVGELTFNSQDQRFVFQYTEKYLALKLIPLGPELPLSREKFVSKQLFESFIDRLPLRENPAYKDYCDYMGIDVNETDPFVLLTTIGKRGPSSFVFEAKYLQTFGAKDVKAFREELELTTKEFAIGFSIAEKTLISIEAGQRTGRDTMKRLELYILFPSVALFEFRRHAAPIHRNKRRIAEQTLLGKQVL